MRILTGLKSEGWSWSTKCQIKNIRFFVSHRRNIRDIKSYL